MERPKTRFWEVDVCRGIAVTAMVIFNWLFALDYLGAYRVNVSGGFWFYFARATAAAFILIAGISLVLSTAKGTTWLQSFKRGLWIFSLGLIITLVTRIFLKEGYVRFGILHLIGLAIILAYPLAKLRYPNILAGSIIIAAGIYLQALSFDFSWLLWLGFVPAGFYTVDYSPVFPWLGVFLIGIFAGNWLYPGYKRNFNIPNIQDAKIVSTFSFLGRNSLFIYLVHQPVLVAILYLAGIPITF